MTHPQSWLPISVVVHTQSHSEVASSWSLMVHTAGTGCGRQVVQALDWATGTGQPLWASSYI